MNKKEIIILISILLVSVVLFTCYRLGYIHFYLSKDSVYAQVTQINENNLEIKSLKTSGGVEKGELMSLTISGDFKVLTESFKVGDKIKFKPTSINKEVNPPELFAKSIELIN